MRKFSLVLAALLIVASGAFAQEINPVLTFEAEAESVFGVNLDGTASSDDGATTGFDVSTDVTLEIEFVEEQTAEFGEGETYGWIEVEDFKIVADGDGAGALTVTDGSVTGKVFFGPAYILVATAGDAVNQGELGLKLSQTILADAADFISLDPATTAVALGFDVPDLLNIEAVVASESTDAEPDWATNHSNEYALALLSEITVDALTVEVDAVTWVNQDADDDAATDNSNDFGVPAAVGLGFEYTLPLNDAIDLVPYLGADLLSGDDTMDFEVIAGVNALWAGIGTDDDDQTIFGEEAAVTSGVGLEFGYATFDDAEENLLWVRTGLYEDEGDDGLLPVVGGALLVEYLLGSDAAPAYTNGALGVGAEVNADLGVVSPYFGLMTANTDLDDGDFALTLNVGTDIDVISNVTFTVDYASGNLLSDADDSAIVYDADGRYAQATALGTTTDKLGALTIGTKISY